MVERGSYMVSRGSAEIVVEYGLSPDYSLGCAFLWMFCPVWIYWKNILYGVFQIVLESLLFWFNFFGEVVQFLSQRWYGDKFVVSTCTVQILFFCMGDVISELDWVDSISGSVYFSVGVIGIFIVVGCISDVVIVVVVTGIIWQVGAVGIVITFGIVNQWVVIGVHSCSEYVINIFGYDYGLFVMVSSIESSAGMGAADWGGDVFGYLLGFGQLYPYSGGDTLSTL